MWSQILTQLQVNGLALITAGGTVNPYVGGAVALLVAAGLAYASYRAKAEAWNDQKNQSGTTTGTEVGNNANTVTPVENGGDNFLKVKKKD